MKRYIIIFMLFFLLLFIFLYLTLINTNSIKNNIIINDNYVYYNNSADINILYSDAINEVSNLMKEMNVESSIEALYIFEYILSNGYISIKKPNFNTDESYLLDLNNEELLGLDVIYGDMNCRHMTDFFTKVLKNLGYDAYAMPCFITDNTNENSAIPNHVITVVNEQNVIYLDAANNIVFDRYNSNYLSDKNNEYYVVAMPDYSSYDKNVVVSHNTDNEIVYINEIYNDDNISILSKTINKVHNKTIIKVILNMKKIIDFKNLYKKEIINKLPDKKLYMSNV